MTQQHEPNTMTQANEALGGRIALFDKGGTDVFAKVKEFIHADLVRQMNIYPYYQVIEYNEGSTCVINGKEVIMLGSNNYLGLTTHREVRKAAAQAVYEYGTSLTGSRLLNGTHKLHLMLEEALAAFLNKPACLVFATGYQTNVGILSALVGHGNFLVMDKMAHASIYDGGRVAKGDVVFFKHNDMADLEKVLGELPKDAGKLIMTDGVFSMEGDVMNLPGITGLCQKYQARLVVDDAHGLGMLGKCGRGTANHFNLEDKVDLIAGTFSKSLASVGGFVAGDAKVIDFIRHYGRSILFSASLPPASTAAAHAALEVLKREPERVDRLLANGHYMRENLKSLGFDIGDTETPIIPVIVGDDILCLTLWRELLEAGIYVNSVVYPAVSRNRALLRTSYTSEHSREQLDKAIEKLVELKKKHGF